MSRAPRKKVEVLYFEGCPNHRPTAELAREVAAELGVDAEVEEVEIRTLEDAERLCFLGSPSVRVDGLDIEPGARSSTAYAFACRTYGRAAVPAREMLAGALREVRAATPGHERKSSRSPANGALRGKAGRGATRAHRG